MSCVRCETSYYCEGDGEQQTCGRCENTSVTCTKDPTEHSFGLASECTSCPVGWVSIDVFQFVEQMDMIIDDHFGLISSPEPKAHR